MAKKRRSRVVGYTVPIRVGDVTIPIKGKTVKAARAKANAFKRHHLKNVERGFFDASGFHPLRSSADYSAARAGEGSSKRARSARTSRAIGKGRARARTARARRGRQAVS